MKQIALLLFIIICVFQVEAISQDISPDYKEVSKKVAHNWFNKLITEISNDQLCNILYTLILTHHLIQCSLDMTFYKLALQEEALGLYSPSITDSLHAPIKMKQNNFTEIYKTLRMLEETQHKLQAAYKQMQIIGPHIIALPVSITQTFINNIKTVLVSWSKHQKKIFTKFMLKAKQLQEIENELPCITVHYKNMISSNSLDHVAIKQFASTLSHEYHKIEKSFLALIFMNKNRASDLKSVFTLAFKDHFTPLYKELSQQNKEAFFAEIDNLEIGLIDMSFIS